ncbi:MAG: hypothetical protein M1820_010566 [Bogoriella megaspora]|nr:MAG: hypothetical protein M1820_010566 [Bogoriella megaspora]
MEASLNQELLLTATGSTEVQERYNEGPRAGTLSRSAVLLWKNNLTALSKSFNLFFLASMATVLVYDPEFPSQTLGEARFKISLPVSSENLPGYNNPDIPHGINHLLVDFLGDEEILAVACDDGDVMAYYLKDIQHAIDIGKDCDLRPFIHENVSDSAWGLAVHRQARMLAVSSNTKQITVYGFALEKLPCSCHHQSNDPSSWLGDNRFDSSRESTKGSTFLYNRTRNRRMILKTGFASSNIPCINFCNAPEDPHGRFLISTNVQGVTTVWDLENNCDVEELIMRTRRISDKWEDFQPSFSRNCSVWYANFLDRRSFRMAKGEPGLPQTDTMGIFWDAQDRVALSKEFEYQLSADQPNMEDESEVDNSAEPSEVDNGHIAPLPETSEPVDDILQNSSSYLDQSQARRAILDHPLATRVLDQSELYTGVLADCNAGQNSILPNCPILQTSIQDIFLFQPEPNTSGRNQTSIPLTNGSECKVPTKRVFTSRSEVHEFNSSNILPQRFCPVQILHDPLMEAASVSPHWVAQHERFNLVQCIPELGIVVVGSGKGLVAILQLIVQDATYRTVKTSSPQSTYINRTEIYSFRLAHVIPFNVQEAAKLRPRATLVGVAVGPVQGSPRRWRLLLTYFDCSVLTYEVCRATDQGGGSPGLHELIV